MRKMCEILPDEGSGKSGVKQFIMEKLCRIRDIYRSIVEFETEFEHTFGLSLNEGMLLCSLKNNGKLTSGHIAEMLGLTCSNTSKVIRSLEEKGYIERIPGDHDKRQMYFTLTDAGNECLAKVKCADIHVPELLENVL